jgi:hypothetical protein
MGGGLVAARGWERQLRQAADPPLGDRSPRRFTILRAGHTGPAENRAGNATRGRAKCMSC